MLGGGEKLGWFGRIGEGNERWNVEIGGGADGLVRGGEVMEIRGGGLKSLILEMIWIRYDKEFLIFFKDDRLFEDMRAKFKFILELNKNLLVDIKIEFGFNINRF